MPARGGGESGHSLAEVMVSIVILCAAIIPMVTMLDTGLHLATRGAERDAARSFAREVLEGARTLSYAEVRDGFDTPSALPVPREAGLPAGATYVVTKRYVEVSGVGGTGTPASLVAVAEDRGLVRLEVTVRWGSDSLTSSTVLSDGGA